MTTAIVILSLIVVGLVAYSLLLRWALGVVATTRNVYGAGISLFIDHVPLEVVSDYVDRGQAGEFDDYRILDELQKKKDILNMTTKRQWDQFEIEAAKCAVQIDLEDAHNDIQCMKGCMADATDRFNDAMRSMAFLEEERALSADQAMKEETDEV